ncbi:MAG: 50S ribosomal protein L3 N(5)-glutamine methyltransferase [Gammaproteobacteria bacterium]
MRGLSHAGAMQNLRTVNDLIRWGASRFGEADIHFGHGTDNAIDEAAQLTLHALHLPATLPPALYTAALTDDEIHRVIALLERRITERKPAAYLTGDAWFCGLPFHVDERVLIPRSPIAEMITRQFEPWVDADQVERVLDICTGSACIAVACAYAFPNAAVDASDLSPGALEVAAMNVERHHVAGRVHLYQSDLFAAHAGRHYDLIVANPPYVDADEMDALAPEFRHEPELGLTAGADGLDLALRILDEAPGYLTDDGVLVCEVGASAPALAELLPDLPLSWVEFEHGGDGVFVIDAQGLRAHKTAVAAALKAR